jgi:hypothetical protein
MARHNPRCALCGAPTRPQTVGGVQSLVCVACGAATVDQRALEQLVQASQTPPPAPPAPEPPRGLISRADELTLEEPMLHLEGLAALGESDLASELEHLRTQRRRQIGLLVTLVVAVGFGLVVVVVALLAAGALWGVSAVSTPAPPAEPPPMLAPADPEEAPPAAPEPAPVAEPAAPPPAPADPVKGLLKAGWEVASRQPVDGERLFREALTLRPGHLEASYGLGYCLLKQGRTDEATQPLCTAKNSSDAEMRRDVDALLTNAGLTCPR